jgi:hypothetical protein
MHAFTTSERETKREREGIIVWRKTKYVFTSWFMNLAAIQCIPIILFPTSGLRSDVICVLATEERRNHFTLSRRWVPLHPFTRVSLVRPRNPPEWTLNNNNSRAHLVQKRIKIRLKICYINTYIYIYIYI